MFKIKETASSFREKLPHITVDIESVLHGKVNVPRSKSPRGEA
jgi:hypothetical protein